MRGVFLSVGHHHHRHRIRGFGYFKRLGPGIVTGTADDDPSGIGTYSQVGAQFRFGFLWTTPLSFLLASAVQENARLGLVTGKGLAALIRERFPKAVLLGAVLLASAANVFNIAADLRAMAASTRLMVPIPFLPLVVGIALVVLALEVLVSYHRYSKVLRWLTLSLGAYIAVVAVVKVDWSARHRRHGCPISQLRAEFAGCPHRDPGDDHLSLSLLLASERGSRGGARASRPQRR